MSTVETNVILTVQEIVDQLRNLQRHRRPVLKAQNRLDNQARAIVRTELGWQFDLSEKERDKINARARRIVGSIRKGEPVAAADREVAEIVLPYVLAFTAAERILAGPRKVLEKRMEELVYQLPVWPWVGAQHGFGAIGVACIIGEAGNLSNYPDEPQKSGPACLWKRFGLAPGQRKSRDPELAVQLGYSPFRRSVMWNIGNSMIQAGEQGAYRSVYDKRKEYERAREPEPEKFKMRIHRRAQKYMEKRMLLHLWKAWRDAAKRQAG